MTRSFLVVPYRMLAGFFLMFSVLLTGGTALLVVAAHGPAALWIVPIGVAAVLLLLLPLFGFLYAPHVINLGKITEPGLHWGHCTYDEAEWRVANRTGPGGSDAARGTRRWSRSGSAASSRSSASPSRATTCSPGSARSRWRSGSGWPRQSW